MKSFVLAGGSGTSLYPITKGVSTPLLPIYVRSMVYEPSSGLMPKGGKPDVQHRDAPQELVARLLRSITNYRI